MPTRIIAWLIDRLEEIQAELIHNDEDIVVLLNTIGATPRITELWERNQTQIEVIRELIQQLRRVQF